MIKLGHLRRFAQPLPARTMEIEEVSELTDEVLDALRRLVPQLAPGNPPPSRDLLERILAARGSVLFVARTEENGPIVGTLTLVSYPIPTGTKVWIEDVVVDRAARGRGVGEALVRAALARAAGWGAPAVNLTSNPSREAANRLYPRLGFQRRETNSYRYLFPDE